MADQHDAVQRWSDASPKNSPLPSAPALDSDPVRGFPPDPTDLASQSYQALSILALIGFALGLVFSVSIILLGIVSFSSNKPLMVPSFLLILPVVSILLCVIARVRISQSEGTMAGSGLARWGLLLSLFVGLGYTAYSTAVNIALRQQSQAFAEKWLRLIHEKKLEQAALLTLHPAQRANLREDDPNLARKLNERGGVDIPGEEGGGLLTQFTQMELIRLLSQGGDQVELESRGIRALDYQNGGFKITMMFGVKTPEASFESGVTIREVEMPGKSERQWFVDLKESGINDREQIRFTELGKSTARVNLMARAFVNDWKTAMETDRLQAFLLTLPHDQRIPAVLALTEEVGGGLVVGSGIRRASKVNEVAKQLQDFKDAKLVVINEAQIVGGEPIRELINEHFRQFFSSPIGSVPQVIELRNSQPGRVVRNGKVLYTFDLRLGAPRVFGGEGVLVLEGDAKALETPESIPYWRVVSMRLTSAQRMTSNSPPPDKPSPVIPRR